MIFVINSLSCLNIHVSLFGCCRHWWIMGNRHRGTPGCSWGWDGRRLCQDPVWCHRHGKQASPYTDVKQQQDQTEAATRQGKSGEVSKPEININNRCVREVSILVIYQQGYVQGGSTAHRVSQGRCQNPKNTTTGYIRIILTAFKINSDRVSQGGFKTSTYTMTQYVRGGLKTCNVHKERVS